ncbi:matrixin family metalloprotease [Klenkia sp. PcliD-1-E]|uniref:matrixin family metalloprotease n=1 Tax=Klenkia sp. PcliD-1-E TaxID=2954492 RepID=UPI0020981AB7|nr:matrixin family metalloprotease [Klenkia sp. PcliD-1-E]MCO7218443.1 matrixin family metalloprotease [Klenkia sp. PcliD-1-E]
MTSPRRRSRLRAAALVVLAVEVPVAAALLVARTTSSAQALEPGAHAFIQEHPDGTPVTWDPCSPIGYAVNWDHAPAGALELLTDAVDSVEDATGLTFQAVGATRVSPTSASAVDVLPAGAEVLVSWVPTADEQLYRDGEALAWARPVVTGGVYTRGQVSLDADWFAAASREQARGVLLHELGHLVGLDHVDDPSQLMDAGGSRGRVYQQGDLEGLAELGPRSGPRCS